MKNSPELPKILNRLDELEEKIPPGDRPTHHWEPEPGDSPERLEYKGLLKRLETMGINRQDRVPSSGT
jgi:hypothetical protein